MERDYVRQPAVAGAFYPDHPMDLESMMDDMLKQVPVVIPAEEVIAALVSPHAGYVYSGPVAAYGFKQLAGRRYETVIVISPSHMEGFYGISVFPGKSYATPLGEIEMDVHLAEKLVQASEFIEFSEKGHKVESERGEHALEVQLPFLQHMLPQGFRLVPLVMGNQSEEMVNALGDVLASVFTAGKTLLVASSDLSHYHPYETANALDSKLIKLFDAFDSDGILKGLETFQFEACGGGPIVSVLKAFKNKPGVRSRVLHHATSGDVEYGDKRQVVGYFSGAVTIGESA